MSVPAAAESSPVPNFYQLYSELETAAARTHRKPLNEVPSGYPPLSALTRMRRVLPGSFGGSHADVDDARVSNSNVSLIAQGPCHFLAAGAGHSVLDPRYKTVIETTLLEVLLPNGSWVTPSDIFAPHGMHEQSLEASDWALMIIPKPSCEQTYDHEVVRTEEVKADDLQQCATDVQFICHHFDQSPDPARAIGQRLIEAGCTLRSRPIADNKDNGHVGYFSCKQSRGVSGCAVLCKQGEEWLNLGIFNKGLRRSGNKDRVQQVGAFRVMDGNLWSQIERLKKRFNMHEPPKQLTTANTVKP